jgi:hypothetical protein
LKIRQVEGYRNYDKSEFESPSAFSDDDDAIEKVWKSQHSLAAFLDPSNFKSYDELKTKLNATLSSGARVPAATSVTPMDAEDELFVETKLKSPAKAVEDTPPWNSAEEDDTMSYFSSLADE